jgi:hypothetical protein
MGSSIFDKNIVFNSNKVVCSASIFQMSPLVHKRLWCFALWVGAATALSAAPAIEFNRDIQPILSDNCFTCHGPDKGRRKAKLRLDTHDGLFSAIDDEHPVVPGKPQKSELYLRLITKDSDDLMPKSKTGTPLPAAQIALIKRWIEQGAPWQDHWAYLPVARSPIPAVKKKAWPLNQIDNFILARLDQEKLKPSPNADKRTLIRRLSFDLIGLPPTPQEVQAFIDDKSPAAYEKLVDRLLASPHYGERMAVPWLDEVRYADTDGFHADNYRSVYPYRDYVIDAFNRDMPFSQFTIEQIAGDLLPKATVEQKIASTYNRLGRSTEEGGAQPKEYLAKYAADRVRATSEVWLGSTMGCCECHDHKFDPFSTKDFYSFEAFFADIKEQGVGAREGTMVPNDQQTAELKRLAAAIAAEKRVLETSTPALQTAQAAWEKSLVEPAVHLNEWHSIGPFLAKSFEQAYDTAFEPEKEIDLTNTYGKDGLKWTPEPGYKDGELHNDLKGTNSATYLYRTLQADAPRPLKLFLGSDDAIKVWLNGQSVLTHNIQRAAEGDQEQIEVPLQKGENKLLLKIVNRDALSGFYFQTGGPTNIWPILAVASQGRTTAQKKELADYFRSISPELDSTRAKLAALTTEKVEFTKTIPTTLVTVATEPRITRVLPRGNWMSDAGEIVQPAVPHFLPHATNAARATRLDLATWIVARNNPLTARVFVNRLWKLYFGTGLTKTLDDFGTRGETPSHPELLDWLASEFMDSGWDVKHMVKLMVMSHTYRQTAVTSDLLRERDPFNRLLARQSSFRLDAELVRDNALAIGGLLVDKIGGPSVKPYQPAGYWDQLNFPKRTYQADQGDALYRRGLYTFWCRTFLQPSLQAFDAPSREECTIDRVNSNTPLQALALLDDPTYVEAARGLAEQVVRQGGPKVDDRINWTFMRALDREPNKEEADLLAKLYREEYGRYAANVVDAKDFLSTGEQPVPKDLNVSELAAWTSVSRVVLNLHETITRD